LSKIALNKLEFNSRICFKVSSIVLSHVKGMHWPPPIRLLLDHLHKNTKNFEIF
jgi:hypothetical protein